MIANLNKVSGMRLTAETLSARRGEDLIFKDISFSLEGGQSLVLTGKNGSGKSTLLRTVAGLLRPESGRVIWEHEGAEAGMRAAEACHYLGHRNAMKPDLTVQENLNFWKVFCGNDEPGIAAVAEAAWEVGLPDLLHLPFGYLSAGQQRRIAFAKLLVADRRIWILDEPTAALDTGAEEILIQLMNRHLVMGGIVITATHQPLALENAQELRMTGFAGVMEEMW